MELYDKLTAHYFTEHFSTSTTQTVIEEEDQLATTQSVIFEHAGIEVLKIDKTLFVIERDRQANAKDSASVEVCDGAIATEEPMPFIGYVELKSKCSQNEVIKARSQIMASYHHMLSMAQTCSFALSDVIQKGIIVTQPVTDEILTKARQRRKRDDDMNVTYSSARFLLKLIAGEAKDESTGISFIYVAEGKVQLSDLLKD
jgi:hypothetical protein